MTTALQLAVRVVFEGDEHEVIETGPHYLGVVIERRRHSANIYQELVDVATRERIASNISDGAWIVDGHDHTFSKIFITAVS